MYIVTGAAGFIGSAILWELNNRGITNIIAVDNLAHSEKWKNLVNRTYTDYIHKNDFLEILKSNKLKNIKAIIHMGACSSTTETNADYLMKNNFEYSKELCLFAIDNNIRFINASSAATYGDGSIGFDDNENNLENLKPLNMYGYTKLLFDLWAKRNNLLPKIASLKFFNVYGPNEYHKESMKSVVNKSFYQIKDTGKVQLFKSNDSKYADGCQLRDFVYIKDCTKVIYNLTENKNINGVFNLGTGKARTWLDLINSVANAMGAKVDIEFIDMPKNLIGKYQNFTEAKMNKLRQKGYNQEFYSLENGVKDYVQNYLEKKDNYL